MKIRFIKPHNGYQAGEEIDVDHGVANAIVEWAKAAVYVTTAPEPSPPIEEAKTDKHMKSRGGKSHVALK